MKAEALSRNHVLTFQFPRLHNSFGRQSFPSILTTVGSFCAVDRRGAVCWMASFCASTYVIPRGAEATRGISRSSASFEPEIPRRRSLLGMTVGWELARNHCNGHWLQAARARWLRFAHSTYRSGGGFVLSKSVTTHCV